MPKSKTVYECENCGHTQGNWSGQCPSCGEWNTLAEKLVQPSKKNLSRSGSGASNVVPIRISDVKASQVKRISSGFIEFDRVLGGGFVPGQVVLLTGEPGIGKSTVLTQLAKNVYDKSKKDVLYVAGEESPQQIKLRSDRLSYSGQNLEVLSETNLSIISDFIESKSSKDTELVIVDSIQTLTSDDLTGVAGSIGQVRMAAQLLTNIAKKINVPLILVGHVNKEGTIAGPKVLEHIVDTVLHLEGDSQHLFRVLKTNKNRFGPVSEVGIFEMESEGLREVTNPSEILLSNELNDVSGSCVTVVMEGHRPILFEIQALTTKTAFGYPRRTTNGINVSRLQLLIAILQKRCGVNLSNHDVYVNVAGGFKISEYACDLAICVAIVSALQDKPVKPDFAAFGECGLLGEVRRVSQTEKRLQEAKKLGYNNVIDPESTKSVKDALKKAFK